MKKLLICAVALMLVGCASEPRPLPNNVKQMDVEKTVIYNDHRQYESAQTTLTKVIFDSHIFIIMRGELGEDFGNLIHHPDCPCN